jgi:hypothetical protein
MLNRNEINSSGNNQFSLYSLFQRAVIQEVNIYNQAYLQLSRPLVQTSIIHPQTKYEIGTYFDIQGELTGKIYCFVDSYGKNLTSDEMKRFTSLFSESMNILLGQTMTNLDSQSNLFTNISTPKKILLNNFKKIDTMSSRYQTFSLGYKLISDLRAFDCRIIINTTKHNLSEV